MIVITTVSGHRDTVADLVSRKFSDQLPEIKATSYDRLFRREVFPNATYIFTDFERLYPWEQRLAGHIYRALVRVGMRCLNDPATVMARYELLRTLHRVGINPFTVYRADDDPRPARFPVFIRGELDHSLKSSRLLSTQEALDEALRDVQRLGTPWRGLLVAEFCGQPVAPGQWLKASIYRVATRFSIDPWTIQDDWVTKSGSPIARSDELLQAEHDAVAGNAPGEAVETAFGLGGIDYGRADLSYVDGRPVIYEINTNPFVNRRGPQASPLRDRTIAIAAERLVALFHAIDSGEGQPVRMRAEGELARYRADERPGATRP